MPLKALLFSAVSMMIDWMKMQLQWLLTRLYPTSVLTVHWCQMISYLAEQRESRQRSPQKLGFFGKLHSNWPFHLWKAALYTFIVSIAARCALAAYLQFTKQPIEPYSHLLGPLSMALIKFYRILNLPHAMAAASLLALDTLYVDYLCFFKFDTALLDISVDLTARNRAYFTQLYGKLTFWEKASFLGELRKAQNGGKGKQKHTLGNFPKVSQNILEKTYLLEDIVEIIFAWILITGCK